MENNEENGAFLRDDEPVPFVPTHPVQTLRFLGDVSTLMTELGAAQGEFTHIYRDTTGQAGNQRFRYAPLSTILASVRPALASHGIALMQPLTQDPDGGHRITTILAGHGGMIIAEMKAPRPEKEHQDERLARTIQNWGSSITYFRRYAVNGLLCLDADPDMDEPGKHHDQQAPSQQRKSTKKSSPKLADAPASNHKDETHPVELPEPEPEPASFVEPDDQEACTPEEGQEIKTLMKRAGVKPNQIGRKAMELTGVSTPQDLVIGDLLKKEHYRKIKQALLLQLTEPQE